MSKKSRRRNKKILGALLLGGLGLAAANRGKGTATGVSGSDKAKFTSDKAYSPSTTVTTKKTIQDNKPVIFPCGIDDCPYESKAQKDAHLKLASHSPTGSGLGQIFY